LEDIQVEEKEQKVSHTVILIRFESSGFYGRKKTKKFKQDQYI